MKRTLKNEQGIANTMATLQQPGKSTAVSSAMLTNPQSRHDDTPRPRPRMMTRWMLSETDARTLALLDKQGKEKEFDGIDLLVTRVISAFKACGASAELVRRGPHLPA